MGAAEGRGTNQKDALLLASHLIIHLPPRIGAYVLASHPDLAKITADTTGSGPNSRSQFQVRQNAQFRSPQHLVQPQVAIDAAREQAILGHVPAHLIPALASPNTDIINGKITWTLRFPMPAPAEGDPQNHRFADLALHASGHRSAAALRNTLQLATATAPPDHEPSNARFIRLSDPTNGHNNAIQDPAAPPSAAIIRWLRGGELLVSHHASSRTPLPAHTAWKHCSCFSAANSPFPYAPGSSSNTKDQPEAVAEAKTSFHRAKEADSRTPREQPLTHHSARQRLPAISNPIGAPPSTHKGKGKDKLSDRPPLHIQGKNKGKKAPTKAPRKDPSKVLEKEQARAKAKAKEKERATNNSRTSHFPSHCNGITPSLMAAAPPYRCTRLPWLQVPPTHAYHTLATGSSTI